MNKICRQKIHIETNTNTINPGFGRSICFPSVLFLPKYFVVSQQLKFTKVTYLPMKNLPDQLNPDQLNPPLNRLIVR